MFIFTGIGSRETPDHILKKMAWWSHDLTHRGWTLRSGGAAGADQTFEYNAAKWMAEIYLPWRGFEMQARESYKEFSYEFYPPTQQAFEMAEKFHPVWNRLSDGAKKLQARNCHQILGHALDTPSDLVICWTAGAKLKGGTAQALRIAIEYEIPIFNFGKDNIEPELTEWIIEYESTNGD